MKQPTIAIVDPVGKHGGFHYYIDGLSGGLQRNGVRVLTYVSELTGVSGKETYEAFVAFGQLYGADPMWLRGLRYLRGLISALFSARFRGARAVSFHIFNFDWRDVFAVWIARLLGMKVVLTLHDVENFGKRTLRILRSLTLAGASGYIFHNNFSYNAFKQEQGVIRKPIAIIPHGDYVDFFPDPATREVAREHLHLPQEPMLFLFFGNSRMEKGLDLLIGACAKLSLSQDWKLIIAGKMKPHQLEYYASLVKEHHLGDRVRIDAKHVSDEEAVSYYRAADLVVVPYRRIYESGVTIMAMSLGRAVLVSNLVPLIDSIAGGNVGYIFQSDDVDALAEALMHAAEERKLLDEVGDRGREHVMNARGWNKIGKATASFFETVLSSGIEGQA